MTMTLVTFSRSSKVKVTDDIFRNCSFLAEADKQFAVEDHIFMPLDISLGSP